MLIILLKKIGRCWSFWNAPYTFVNERLAQHYGIPDVHGSHFRKINLTGKTRGGLLGQGSILTITSYAKPDFTCHPWKMGIGKSAWFPTTATTTPMSQDCGIRMMKERCCLCARGWSNIGPILFVPVVTR